MTTDNFCFYFQNRLIQTSQTEGQWYNDTSPLVFLATRNSSARRVARNFKRYSCRVFNFKLASFVNKHGNEGSWRTHSSTVDNNQLSYCRIVARGGRGKTGASPQAVVPHTNVTSHAGEMPRHAMTTISKWQSPNDSQQMTVSKWQLATDSQQMTVSKWQSANDSQHSGLECNCLKRQSVLDQVY